VETSKYANGPAMLKAALTFSWIATALRNGREAAERSCDRRGNTAQRHGRARFL
jgi:hypothetical protein